MWRKFLSVAAVMFLVTACETPPGDAGSVTGSGSTYDGSPTGRVSTSGAAPSGLSDIYGGVNEIVENVPDRVFFAFDSSVLNSDAQKVLRMQAKWLKANPSVSITIEGHADERGTREYNLALGERRANAVKNYLTSLGVSANRVRTISFGKERPAVVGSNDVAWAKNRRSVTVVR